MALIELKIVFRPEPTLPTKAVTLAVKRSRIGDIPVEMDSFDIIEIVGRSFI